MDEVRRTGILGSSLLDGSRAAPSTATAGPGSDLVSGRRARGHRGRAAAEALADAAAEMSEREEELQRRSIVQQLQLLLKSQSDALADVQGARRSLRANAVSAREAGGGSVATALQALEAQVTRQKATIVSLRSSWKCWPTAGRSGSAGTDCRHGATQVEVDGLLDEVAEDRSSMPSSRNWKSCACRCSRRTP